MATKKSPVKTQSWFVYIILCDDDSLYTGITIDLEARLATHKSGKGAKYTRTRGAQKIVFSEEHQTRQSAMLRELQIKKLPRQRKLKLVNL
jgi:putative endonuclease